LNGLIFSYLGDQYYSQYSFDGAIAAYSSAIPFFETLNNKTYLLYVLWRKGVSLNLADNPQQAIECLSEAQTIAVDLEDLPAILDITASIGGIKIGTLLPINISDKRIMLHRNFSISISVIYIEYILFISVSRGPVL